MIKKVAIAFLLMCILLLNSCTFGGGRMSFDFDENIIDNQFKQVVKVINNQDRDALRAMFSKQALAGDADFDDSMDKFLSLFQGKVESWERTGGPGVEEENNADGTGGNRKEMRATYDAKIGGENYHFSIKKCTQNTKNTDNIGVISICVINAEDWKSECNYWGDLNTPGIVID